MAGALAVSAGGRALSGPHGAHNWASGFGPSGALDDGAFGLALAPLPGPPIGGGARRSV